MEKVKYFLRRLTSFPIILYRLFVRPLLRPSCRYYPSCSEYALSAINHFGIFKGIKLMCCRLLRCHPWSAGGYDPVLRKEEKS
ncbi:Protein YidD [Legionella beliardensis]|uniref:Putative membrane protein insertion efficiency factor n=1 Tax=Legionella beliardensis TaxID=91822 RepID=A0A378I683_9GAMM|nr:membrane protein insertion efficiency factor YidD [Legionella beliardensis]STX30245.1 Protein YidD [Legionella beliardensis]